MTSQIRIGTSGWIYKHWRGIFYPEKLPQKLWLDFYAEHFDTVEVNFSFYRLPTRQAFESWRDRAPSGFCYAVKGSRYVTHLKRLLDPEQHVRLFIDHLAGLADRTGPILWQLPPNFRRDDQRLAAFLETLPSDYRHTIEFRHASWLAGDVYSLLEAKGVALCIPVSPNLPRTVRLTADWTYVRFHYGGDDGKFAPHELAEWAEVFRDFQRQDAEIWTFFNNDWHGYAIENAVSLRNHLSGTM